MQRVVEWILRIGLMATFLYAGVDMIVHPGDWVGFFPPRVLELSPLKANPLAVADGIVQVVLALALLHRGFVRSSSALIALMLAGILVTTGPLLVTFRDIGLLAMAIALVVYPQKAEKDDAQFLFPHVGVICLRDVMGSLEVLVAQRSANRKLYPSQWEAGGGRINAGETLELAAKRHLLDDFKVHARVVAPVATYTMHSPKGKMIQGVKMLCVFERYDNGQGVLLNREKYLQWKWLPVTQLEEVQWIQGNERSAKEDVDQAIAYYQNIIKK